MVGVLLALASIYLHVSPEFAANLPQDALDFALPAINLLEHGKLVLSAYGKFFPLSHSIGFPLLLAPAYAVFGHFPGNGIYLVFAMALATVALVYWIGRAIGGRVWGLSAAIFLITHYGFQQYAKKIMTEVPSVFLLTSIFALVLVAFRGSRGNWFWLLTGALLGLAIAVRFDNILVVPGLLVLLGLRMIKLRALHCAMFLLGMLSWVTGQLALNKIYYGSALRTGAEYYGGPQDAGLPAFSQKNVTTRGYLETRHIPLDNAGVIDGNLMTYTKVVLNFADVSLPFSQDQRWENRPKGKYQVLIVCRTILGLMGLAWCYTRRTNVPEARILGGWTIMLTIASLVFYSLYFWQEERFLLRLSPFYCLLTGGGIAYLWRSGFRSVGAQQVLKTSGLAACFGLPAAFALFTAKDWVLPNDDNLLLYRTFANASNVMEPDAIVISEFDAFRTDAYIVRGTERSCIQLSHVTSHSVYPTSNSPRVSLAPFTALDQPDRIERLLKSGKNVYLLINAFQRADRPGIERLLALVELQPVAQLSYGRNPGIPYLFRLRLRAGGAS